MAVNEIEALRISIEEAQKRCWHWNPPYWIDLENEEWQVQVENTFNIRINAVTGDLVAESSFLSPIAALTLAKEYALKQELIWKPAFSLSLERDFWVVGSCQSQFGGQTYININHQGTVTGHSVNRK